MSNKILLWHGTSTLFLSDIQKNGLQNFDINENYKAIGALNYLLNYIENNIKINNVTANWLSTARDIANQENEYINFEDNDLFVTNSPYKAAEHAVNNIYGSELLSTTANVAKIVVPMLSENEYESFCKNYSKIISLIHTTYAPIILSFRVNIEPNYLRAETNRERIISIKNANNDYKECKESIKNKFYGTGFNNYRLTSNVLPENITAYLCIRNICMKNEDYKFIKLGRLDKIKSTGSISIIN